jgi:hypothetical protein
VMGGRVPIAFSWSSPSRPPDPSPASLALQLGCRVTAAARLASAPARSTLGWCRMAYMQFYKNVRVER